MKRLAAFLVLVLAAGAAAAPAAAQELDLQLQEIRTLVREKRFQIALESLRLVARQIQDLRVASVAPAFPAAPAGWTATEPLSLLEEQEIWGDRIAAQRTYLPPAGQTARIDCVIDVHSPFAPSAALGLNPLVVAGDPRARLVDVGGRQARLRFNPDTVEGELRLLIGRGVLVTVRSRGVGAGR
jgi:hypothetical protein